jgi:hypothetical protein
LDRLPAPDASTTTLSGATATNVFTLLGEHHIAVTATAGDFEIRRPPCPKAAVAAH